MSEGNNDNGSQPPEVLLVLVNQSTVRCGDRFYHIVRDGEGSPKCSELGYREVIASAGETKFIDVTGVPDEKDMVRRGYISGKGFKD